MLTLIISIKKLALLVYLGRHCLLLSTWSLIQQLSHKRAVPFRFLAQDCSLPFISRCFVMLWPSGFCRIGNIFYKH